MFTYCQNDTSFSVDFGKGTLKSLIYKKIDILADEIPIFKICLMDKSGNHKVLTSDEATSFIENGNGATYGGFSENIEITIRVECDKKIKWYLNVKNNTDKLIEWVEYSNISLKPLVANGGIGKILYPYNEGAIIDDMEYRESSGWFSHREPSYPSHGSYSVFPNMICSQFLCYLFEGKGLYIGAHDEKRGLKQIDFYKTANGVAMQIRIYRGLDFGQDYTAEYPIVWQMFDGEWQDGADLYKKWFETHLPEGTKKVKENTVLPEWYKESPLVVSYPVRGVHDTDIMTPNALFPYENALSIIDEIAERTKSKILVLLMHWEGTAPWAPPYVWPPFGGEEMFFAFQKKLHERNHLLGVYCSGFGYTKKSNLVDYDNEKEYAEKGYESAMCASPAGKVELSNICRAQRSGYDICVASEKAKEILNKAYEPLFENNIDYVQILDQNHGGGQYFCYSRDHKHPPAPGTWMTENMQKFLENWNKKAGKTIFGCESAASEAFIPNLLFSDNRFELNWYIGKPVPLYAYLYHEYLHNFMGNQCACGLSNKEENLCYRMAYSFTAGDCITVVLMPDGNIFPNWGCHDFSYIPDKDKALEFISNMTKLYNEYAKTYLIDGKMIKPLA